MKPTFLSDLTKRSESTPFTLSHTVSLAHLALASVRSLQTESSDEPMVTLDTSFPEDYEIVRVRQRASPLPTKVPEVLNLVRRKRGAELASVAVNYSITSKGFNPNDYLSSYRQHAADMMKKLPKPPGIPDAKRRPVDRTLANSLICWLPSRRR